MADAIAAHQGKALDEQGLKTIIDELEQLSEDEAKKLAGNLNSEESKH